MEGTYERSSNGNKNKNRNIIWLKKLTMQSWRRR